jgi:hypothetical protein
MSPQPSSLPTPDVLATTTAETTSGSSSSSVDERWEAWRAKGAAQDRAFRRQLAVGAPVVAIVAAAIFYALVVR